MLVIPETRSRTRARVPIHRHGSDPSAARLKFLCRLIILRTLFTRNRAKQSEPGPDQRNPGPGPNAAVTSCRECSRSERSRSIWLEPSTVSVPSKLPPWVSCSFSVTA